MFLKLAVHVLVANLVLLGLMLLQPQASAQPATRFVCARSFDPKENQQYWATFAFSAGQKKPIIVWNPKTFPSYSSRQRCQEASARLQTAFKSGRSLITNGEVKGKPVICAVRYYGEPCTQSNLLLTLRAGEDSFKTLNVLKTVLNARQQGPLWHSGRIRQAYYQFDLESML